MCPRCSHTFETDPIGDSEQGDGVCPDGRQRAKAFMQATVSRTMGCTPPLPIALVEKRSFKVLDFDDLCGEDIGEVHSRKRFKA